MSSARVWFGRLGVLRVSCYCKLEMHGFDPQMCSTGKKLEMHGFDVLMCSTGCLGVGQ